MIENDLKELFKDKKFNGLESRIGGLGKQKELVNWKIRVRKFYRRQGREKEVENL